MTISCVVMCAQAMAWAQASVAVSQGQSVQKLGASGTDLRTLLGIAVTQHPSLRAREADVGAAKSEIETARWQFWPTPSLSIQHPDKVLYSTTDRVVTTLSVRQSIWTGGRLEAGLANANASEAVAKATREETRRDIAIELIQAYGDAHTARARLKVYDANLAIHRKLLEQIQRRTKAGISVESDIALARSRYESSVADQSNARALLDAALDKLQTLVGRPVTEDLLPIDGFAQDGMPVDVRVVQAQQVDPSLKRMQAEALGLQAHVDSIASANWPDLYASISRRQGDVTGRTAQVMVGLETKLGAGLSNASAVQAARQRQQAKQEDIDYRTRKLTEQIRSDLRLRDSMHERVKSFTDSLRAANVVAQSWDRQFGAGKKAWQDVMNAARESAQTEIQLVDAKGALAVLDWRIAVLTHGVQWVLENQPGETAKP